MLYTNILTTNLFYHFKVSKHVIELYQWYEIYRIYHDLVYHLPLYFPQYYCSILCYFPLHERFNHNLLQMQIHLHMTEAYLDQFWFFSNHSLIVLMILLINCWKWPQSHNNQILYCVSTFIQVCKQSMTEINNK
jgi:hypothetical protein